MGGIVTFGSKAAGEVIMLKDHVAPLFEAIGWPLQEMSAIAAEDLPDVIRTIETAIEEGFIVKTRQDVKNAEFDQASEDADNAKEKSSVKVTVVASKTRFYPLLDLMRQAAAKGEFIHWS